MVFRHGSTPPVLRDVMMGYGKFIFPVAVIDVAMLQELTAAGSDDFDREVHVVTWL